MDVQILKPRLAGLATAAPFKLPPTGWYYSRERPRGCIAFEDSTWTCMFKLIGRVARGEQICFSAQSTGCRYAAFYLGFERPGPREEASQRWPKAVVGSMDPVVRNYLPLDTISFSVPVGRFVEMTDHLSESFMTQTSWLTVLGRCSDG
jgi:hypothetical protein